MAYKRFYLWGSVSILGILALITPFIDYYYGYNETTYCTDNCWVEFCIKNGNKNLYFYNKDELPLTFYPEDKVSNVKFFKKDGRYKSGFREINFIDSYSKGVLYVFKIPAYSFTCYGMEIKKEWWADIKWSFGELDPMLVSATQVGNKLVKEECVPLSRDLVENIPHYKTCLTFCSAENKSCIPLEYSCLDYVEKKTTKEMYDCKKIGIVNVSNKMYDYPEYWCELKGNEICCVHNKEGGEWNYFRDDLSVDGFCENLITNKKTVSNELKTRSLE